MVILGAMKFNFWIALLAATTWCSARIRFGCIAVIFGEVGKRACAGLSDANTASAGARPASGRRAVDGVYRSFTEIMHASVDDLLSTWR